MTDELEIRYPLGNGLVAVLKIDSGSLTPMDAEADDSAEPPTSTCTVILADVEKPPPRKVTQMQLRGPVKGVGSCTHVLDMSISLDLERPSVGT